LPEFTPKPELLRMNIQRISGWFCLLGAAVLWTAWTTAAGAIPLGDAFENDDGSRRPVYESYEYNPKNDAPRGNLRETNPTLTPHLNEEHPFPEYMKKFMEGKNYPKYYSQLLDLEPVDQVQSMVFDPEAFREVRRIGVIQFENKTRGAEKDASAGNAVAEQLSQELDTVGRYAVIRPKQMVEEYRMKIMTSPEKGKSSKSEARPGEVPEAKTTTQITTQETVYDLPYAAEKIDAVMIGAVTRYSNTFYDQYGKPSRSPAVALEFGAYLISTQTGRALWGARFVGSQKPTLSNIQFGKLRWLNKREFTQFVIRKVLKDFSEADLVKAR